MGFAIHKLAKRDVDSEKHLKRMHKTTAWIESPLTGADHENLVFSQRHEASTIELFFDLFFVANLATFTTYHSVTDTEYLIAYIGFFGILWSCWFQVTLHDVRFSRDSIYERLCKTIQFIVFVGLALVGSSFHPGNKEASNTNFRILCYTLVISRVLLTIQYAVVLFYTYRANYSKLFLPLGLTAGIYALAAIAFGSMTPAFRQVQWTPRSVYVVWYVIMVAEAIGVIFISSHWRMLSFKKTHLMERMSLLTLIVIGEGAIGVTKTVSRLMGKNGLDAESCALIMCIIAVLVFIWAMYFDNFPHGHYGTIRQQVWSLLHFPFQLAIVGVVEGSQQVALARYITKNYFKIGNSISDYCAVQHLDGVKLRDALLKLLDYWHFDKKVETYDYEDYISEKIYSIANQTNICSPANITIYQESGIFPEDLGGLIMDMFDGVYESIGIKLSTSKLKEYHATEIAIYSWKTVYVYYWSSFCILVSCSIGFLFLIRRHKIDVFDFVSFFTRLCSLVVGVAMISLLAKEDTMYNFIISPAVLPVCLALLFLITLGDKIGSVWSNMRLRKSGEKYAMEHEEEHKHTHGDHADARHASLATLDREKSAGWSTVSEREPLTSRTNSSTAYSPHRNYSLSPLSPPMRNPSLSAPINTTSTTPATTPAPQSGDHAQVGLPHNNGA